MHQHIGLPPPSEQIFRSLNARTALDHTDAMALAALTYSGRTIQRGERIAEESEERRYVSFIRAGYAMRYRQTTDGSRQIISVDTTGDIIDASYLFFDRCDQTVEALTHLQLADIAVTDLRHIVDRHPNLFNALVTDCLVHASITQQWLANIGGRSALSRIAHLLCEFAVRVGRRDDHGIIEFDLPITQTELAEILGLTLVHTNRTLKQLISTGLVERNRARLRIMDIAGLEHAADFCARYLHLDHSLVDRRSMKRDRMNAKASVR